MIGEVFYFILNMSITATLIGTLLLLLRLIKGFPKRVLYFLWMIVGIRLIFPFAVNGPFSILSFINPHLKVVPIPSIPITSFSNMVQAVDNYYPLDYKTELLQKFFMISGYAWIMVLILLIISVAILYNKSSSSYKKTFAVSRNIYTSETIMTPITYGVFSQKIIVPSGIDAEILKYAILHEKIHCQRHDNFWRILAIIICCIHWFNPLVWIFLKLFFRDLENSCDEIAIKNMSLNERKAYSTALLQVGTDRNSSFAVSFGGSNIKTRIINILNYKKLSILSTSYLFIFVMVLFYILLTNTVR